MSSSTPRKERPRESSVPVLDDINEQFHDAYERACADATHDAPVLVMLPDQIVVHRAGGREAVAITPTIFHVIKSVAHGPVALFALVHHVNHSSTRGAIRLDSTSLAQVERGRMKLEEARHAIDDLRQKYHSEQKLFFDLERVLDASWELADKVSERAITHDELDLFARDVGPVLLRNLDDATRIQLASLDAHVRRILETFSPEDRRTFQVVVTGNHQARERSMGMQYFQKVMGDDARANDRLTYGEGIVDDAGALDLLGTLRVDRVLARAFFADADRMQRDLLGDAAEKHLRTFGLASPYTKG